MSGASALLLAQVVGTLTLVGVIWFVQVIHYPLMALVGRVEFAAYEAAHVSRTAWVVVPLMLTEAASALALPFVPNEIASTGEALFGLALLGGVWASTFVLQVPLHARLGAGFEQRDHRRLVRTNAIRTVLWSGRGLLVLVWVARALP